MRLKRGQIAIFIIIGVAIVGLIAAFLVFRDRLGLSSVPAELQPVFNYYTTCIEDVARTGISLEGSQGGFIDVGPYVPGSDYAPFSSHLLFSGLQIPYWFSLSGNGLVSEHVPTRSDMEADLASFLTERLSACDFSIFQEQGFTVNVSDSPRAEVSIGDTSVNVRIIDPVSVRYGDERAVRDVHDVQLQTNLGSLHAEALSFYQDQQANVYLDQYAADFLRLYTPVDGVSVQCSPETWKTRDVFDTLGNALEANFAHIRFSNAAVSNPNDRYFTIPHRMTSDARVLYSRSWPMVFEVSPANDELMIAEPVGNQEGLGVLGFCYVPYHFLYDVRFPVLVQLTKGNDVFQFPLLVIIDKNAPRNALSSGVAEPGGEPDVCSFKEGSAHIATYDTHLNPVEAEVFYQCFDQRCPLGSTRLSPEGAVLDAALPLCANGQLIARADNFSETRQLFSSNSENASDLILEPLHSVSVRVLVDGQPTRDTAIVHFSHSDGSTVSAVLPDQAHVSLREGLYNVSVFVYGNSSITLPGTTKQQCTNVPRAGFAGFFGGSEEKCFDVTTPETRVDSALRGGGISEDTYLLESELETGSITIYVNGLPAPTTLEQLQTNFELFESARAEVGFS